MDDHEDFIKKLVQEHIFWNQDGKNGYWKYYKSGNSGHKDPAISGVCDDSIKELHKENEGYKRGCDIRIFIKEQVFKRAAAVYLCNTDLVLKLMILNRKFAEHEINTNPKIKRIIFDIMNQQGVVSEDVNFKSALFQNKKWVDIKSSIPEDMTVFSDYDLRQVVNGADDPSKFDGPIIENMYPAEDGKFRKGWVPTKLILHSKEEGWKWAETDEDLVFDDSILNHPIVKTIGYKHLVAEDRLPNALIFIDGKFLWDMSNEYADIWDTIMDDEMKMEAVIANAQNRNI